MNTEFFEAVKILEKEKGVPAELLYEKIQTAIIVAVRKNYHDKDVVCCEIKPEESELNVFLHKTVVNEISDPDTDILTEEAQKYKPVPCRATLWKFRWSPSSLAELPRRR